MARALIVGCGCFGRALGSRLGDDGWSVRGTSRTEAGVAAIESAGFEGAVADPARAGSILDLVGDVAAIHWLLGSASGGEAQVEAAHGDALEALLVKLVDTPVRGFVYEGAGSAPGQVLSRGAALVRAASERWRIPAEVVEADPGDAETWLAEMREATRRVVG